MKNIQTNSYKKAIKQAASFEDTGVIEIEVFDSHLPVRIEYTMSGNEWSGDYMNPPESSIDDIFIENMDESGGLNEKGRKSYNRATGGNLQAPVTEKNPTGKRKARRKSFCARSKGQMKMHNIDCSKTPDKRICKARRRWKC